jgi:hypothetical protein
MAGAAGMAGTAEAGGRQCDELDDKSMFLSFGRFLLVVLLTGMIRRHDPHR